MKKKIKGSSAERDLLNLFWKNNWVGIRVAGSGSSRHPAPDLIVSNGYRRFVIEVKYVNDTKKYFTKKEINELKFFSENFGGEPWVAIKFQGLTWFFLSIDSLKNTGKSFYADIVTAKNFGFIFKEFINLV